MTSSSPSWDRSVVPRMYCHATALKIFRLGEKYAAAHNTPEESQLVLEFTNTTSNCIFLMREQNYARLAALICDRHHTSCDLGHSHLLAFQQAEQDVREFRMFTSKMIFNLTLKAKEIVRESSRRR